MGDVRDIRSARGAPPPAEGQGTYASPTRDVSELVGIASATETAAPMITLERPGPECEGWCFTPEQACELANTLVQAARHCIESPDE